MRKEVGLILFLFVFAIISVGSGSAVTCTDSDGGKNLYTFGYLQMSNESFSRNDSCSGYYQLKEAYCYNAEPSFFYYWCPLGCSGGRCNSPITPTCNETDNGNNLVLRGEVYGAYTNGWFYNITDYCLGLSLVEYLCNGNSFTNSTSTCPNNGLCVDGACNSSSIVYCFDSDYGLNYTNFGSTWGYTYPDLTYYNYSDYCVNYYNVSERYCSGNSSIVKYYPCGNLGANYYCSNGKCVQNQTQQQTCTDSDGGLNYTVYGWTYGYNSTSGVNYNITDSCTGAYLSERYCSGNFSYSSYYNCSGLGVNYICSNGKCVWGDPTPPNLTIYYNYTSGNTAYIGASAQDPEKNIQYIRVLGPLGYVSWWVRDSENCPAQNTTCVVYLSFDYNSSLDNNGDFYKVETISNGGVSSKNVTLRFSSENPPASCVDTDGGASIYVYGYTYMQFQNGTQFNFMNDTCYNSTVLGEKYCSNNSQTGKNYDCARGCRNGACIKNPATICKWYFKWLKPSLCASASAEMPGMNAQVVASDVGAKSKCGFFKRVFKPSKCPNVQSSKVINPEY